MTRPTNDATGHTTFRLLYHPVPSQAPPAMRVLIAPDKFKGTLSAEAVAKAVAAGWKRQRPNDSLALLPISDGGDGFGPVLGTLLDARTLVVPTTNAANRPRRARWWWIPKSRLAILEAAQANGLALLPKGAHHPFDLDSRGVAPLLRAAHDQGARKVIIGVGGSATNDGGFGLAHALGWTFLNRQGQAITRWTDFPNLTRIVPPASPQPLPDIIVATDVDNPLLGTRGATRIYGPQKGLRPEDIPVAEACLKRLATVVKRQLGFDPATPGSGAAGGLGFGLMAFLNAKRRLGFDVFAEHARLDEHLRRADLVITGEGAFDHQSLMGKGVGQCIRHCQTLDRPVIVLAGKVESRPATTRAVNQARGLCDITSPDQAMARPAFWLRRLAADVARDWSATHPPVR